MAWDLSGSEISVQCTTYPPHARMRRHRDARSRLSIALAGAFIEETSRQSAFFAPGDLLFKSSSVAHENCFGNEGATIFSVVFSDDAIGDLTGDNPDDAWRRSGSPGALALGVALVEAAAAMDASALCAALADIFGADEGSPTRRRPPDWLRRLKDDLQDRSLKEIDIPARAIAAGVHPGHLSRLFRRCYGVTLTHHAQTHAVRRALAMIAHGEQSLGAVAAAADFYDQSHMTRTFRRVLARTPAECQRLFATAPAG